jgi:hypothetical protein
VAAAADGLGSVVGDGPVVGGLLGDADGAGPGVPVGRGLSQPMSVAAITAATRPRRTGLDVTGRREGVSAGGTPRMVGPERLQRR